MNASIIATESDGSQWVPLADFEQAARWAKDLLDSHKKLEGELAYQEGTVLPQLRADLGKAWLVIEAYSEYHEGEYDEIPEQKDGLAWLTAYENETPLPISEQVHTLQAELDDARKMIENFVMWLENVDHNYKNGNVAQGTDEGEYHGQKGEKELILRATAYLATCPEETNEHKST